MNTITVTYTYIYELSFADEYKFTESKDVLTQKQGAESSKYSIMVV